MGCFSENQDESELNFIYFLSKGNDESMLRNMEHGLKKVPQQPRGQETRRKLMEAALEQFKTRGYAETTAKHITEAAGVSIGSFYVYFDDKKAVFSELMDLYYESFLALDLGAALKVPRSIETRRDLLRGVIDQVSKFIAEMGDFYSALNVLFLEDSVIRQEIQAFEVRIVETLKSLLSNLPSVRAPLDLGTHTFLLYLFVDNLANRLRFPSPVSDEAAIKEEMVRWLDVLMFEQA